MKELQSKLSPVAAGLREKLGYPVTEGYGMIWLWLRGPITPPTFFTADTVRCGGTRYCLPSNELVYTPSGVITAAEVKEGTNIFGGKAIGPHSFEDDVYEMQVGKTFKFKASSEHPLFISKWVPKNKTRDGMWISMKDAFVNRPKSGKWYVKVIDSGTLDFDTITIGKPMAKLLGYLLSDGTFSENQSVAFTNTNGVLLQDVVELARVIGQEMGFTIKNYWNGCAQILSFTGGHGTSHSLLKDKLREFGIINRNTFGKLQMLQEDELIEFIRGYFNGDGCLSIGKVLHGVRVTFAIGVNERQANELQFMLWRLGVRSNIRRHYYPQHGSVAGQYLVTVASHDSVMKLLKILEDKKYPQKFVLARAKCRLDDSHLPTLHERHMADAEGEWLPITMITKLGRSRVIGWTTEPSNLIIGRLGLKTHNSGKSSLLETLAMAFLERSKVYNPDGTWKITSNLWDIFSASDSEALAYLEEDCPYRKRVVLIKDPSAVVTVPDWLKVVNYTDIHPEYIRADKSPEGGHIYILPYHLFPDKAARFTALATLTDSFNKRENFNTVDVIMIRESSGYLSAIQVAEKGTGINMALARQKMIDFSNELYHHKYAMLIDLQRADAELAKSIREQATYSFYTRLGTIEWPRSKNWVGGYISFDLIRNLPKGWAFCMTDKNGLALVKYDMPKWHFERRGESLLDKFGIKVHFEQPEENEGKGTTGGGKGGYIGKRVDMKTHELIVTMRSNGSTLKAISDATGIAVNTVGYHAIRHDQRKCGCSLLKTEAADASAVKDNRQAS